MLTFESNVIETKKKKILGLLNLEKIFTGSQILSEMITFGGIPYEMFPPVIAPQKAISNDNDSRNWILLLLDKNPIQISSASK